MQTAAASAAVPLGDGQALGIIFPPADIRGIVDKTAQFVAKNGPEFEQRVLADPNNTQRFSFLLPVNPYKAYYDAKVKEFQTGEATEATQQHIPKAIVERQQREAEKKQKKDDLLALTAYAAEPSAAVGFEAKEGFPVLAIEDDRAAPEPPLDDQYSVGHPYAAALDIDVIKLTAQFVARNGQKFLVGLGQRERGNPQFAFLRASHPLFAYFTMLVDAFSKCLLPDKATITRLKEDVGVTGKLSEQLVGKESDVKFVDGVPQIAQTRYSALFNLLQRVYERHRWEIFDEKQKADKEKREADERESMQSMDWHDFAVVEVIDFTEADDHLPLGAPVDKAALLRPTVVAPLAGPAPFASTVAAELQAAVGAEGVAAFKRDMGVAPPPIPAGVPAQPPPPQPAAPSSAPADAPLVVVKGYVRTGVKRGRQDTTMQKCPITGQMVPTSQMTDHLRIVLLDPKWKEQKDIFVEKAKKESALVDGSDFSANLAEFVVNRPDLFGSVEDEMESTYVPGPKRK